MFTNCNFHHIVKWLMGCYLKKPIIIMAKSLIFEKQNIQMIFMNEDFPSRFFCHYLTNDWLHTFRLIKYIHVNAPIARSFEILKSSPNLSIIEVCQTDSESFAMVYFAYIFPFRLIEFLRSTDRDFVFFQTIFNTRHRPSDMNIHLSKSWLCTMYKRM